MRTLRLNVTKEWFDKIASGEKVEDYREIKPYWDSRLFGREYDLVEIKNGYGKDRPVMMFKWDGYRITEDDEVTDLGTGKYYAIRLRERAK